ncbi:clotting factor G beta subunit-like [Euwallacea similis]|uniref:clotting factor G beta subunit-like n=1 Tax=Euwallacea similis TaxID=1736056 RepID=UPI00344B86CE
MKPALLILFLGLNCCPTATPTQQCGRAIESNLLKENERIVAGYDVGYYKYPWFAALMENKMVQCGGALIAPKLVVTAAHCYKEYLNVPNNTKVKLENIYTVRMGMYNICTIENTTKEYKVDKVQVHELYWSRKPYYDICLLTLVNSTDAYEPLCLPKGVVNHRPRDGTVPGMGALKYQGQVPCTLHEARLLIYSDSTCIKMLNDSGNNGSQLEHALCAGYLSGGIDTCQGDSGGPLQVLDENGRYSLLGIVSFGFHCALPKYLGVYTDVSHYINWIKEKSGLDDLNFLSSLVNDTHQNAEKVNDSSNDYENYGHYSSYGHKNPLTIIILKNQEHRKSQHLRGEQRNRT